MLHAESFLLKAAPFSALAPSAFSPGIFFCGCQKAESIAVPSAIPNTQSPLLTSLNQIPEEELSETAAALKFLFKILLSPSLERLRKERNAESENGLSTTRAFTAAPQRELPEAINFLQSTAGEIRPGLHSTSMSENGDSNSAASALSSAIWCLSSSSEANLRSGRRNSSRSKESLWP